MPIAKSIILAYHVQFIMSRLLSICLRRGTRPKTCMCMLWYYSRCATARLLSQEYQPHDTYGDTTAHPGSPRLPHQFGIYTIALFIGRCTPRMATTKSETT